MPTARSAAIDQSQGVRNLARRAAPGLGRIEDRAVDGRQVAAAAQPGLRQPLDHRRRRLVAGEMAGELGREVARGARVGGEIVEHGARLRLALLAIGAAEDGARAGLVDRAGEEEARRARRCRR